MTARGRDALIRELLDELSEADKARFVRGITLGALAGAALAGSVLRARRARRRPRPVLRVEAGQPGPAASAAEPLPAGSTAGSLPAASTGEPSRVADDGSTPDAGS